MPVVFVSRPSWRYMWFCVRVLIILVLVLGFWLVWIVHLAQIQREAVAAIAKDGGTVLYDWEWDNGHSVPAGQPRAPRWLVAQIGFDFFGHATVVKSRSPSLAAGWAADRTPIIACYSRCPFTSVGPCPVNLTDLSKLDLSARSKATPSWSI